MANISKVNFNGNNLDVKDAYAREQILHKTADNYTADVTGNYTVNAGDIAMSSDNYTADVTGNYTVNAGDIAMSSDNATMHTTADRTIDTDGNDSVHINGASTLNVGGLRTETFAGDKTEAVTGTTTEKYNNVNTTVTGKWIMNLPKKSFNMADVLLNTDINEILPFVDPADYGAKLDGITDDTAAFKAALDDGNIKLKSRATVLLNNLSIPDYRIVDFGYSAVKTTSYAIKTTATSAHGYSRGCIIKNALFEIPNVAGPAAHSYGGIYIDGAIKWNIENCELANCYQGGELIQIKNSFNITVNNCHCGTGNAENTTNSCGVYIVTGNPIVQGTDNVTNVSISNMLIQKIGTGILINSTSGLTDTVLISNIGFSYCTIAIDILGTNDASNRNITIDTIRAEFCGTGIHNTGYLSINNPYFTRISKACIENAGYITITGPVCAFNPAGYNGKLYDNTGAINAIGTFPNLINNVPVSNTGIYIKPYGKPENDYYAGTGNAKMTLTGTTGANGGEIIIPYPTGINKNSLILINTAIYRSNLTWVYNISTVTLTNNGISVMTPTNDNTTFSRPIELYLLIK